MDSDFWHERWQHDELGWHREDTHPLLERYWPELNVDASTAVLVPLCGKSRDLLWLAGLGHPVVGVELSAIGTEAFFAENGLTAAVVEDPPFRRYRSGRIEILCGDFFELVPRQVAGIGAVYDRGALVALPSELRERYLAHCRAVLPKSWRSLLITFDYPQQDMDGPPFSIGMNQVERYFGSTHRVQRLAVIDALAENPRFRERGLTQMNEMVFALYPRT